MSTDFLNEFSGMGKENISQEDLLRPFLKIFQALSTMTDHGIQIGEFYNTVSGKSYGKSIKLIPLKFEKIWYEKEGDNFVAVHKPDSFEVDKSDYSNWKKIDSDKSIPNTIIETYMYYVKIADFPEDGILLFPFTSSSSKTAKKWNSLLSVSVLDNGEDAPIWANVWELTTSETKNQKNQAWLWVDPKNGIKKVRFIEKEEFFEHIKPAKELVATMQTSNLLAEPEGRTIDETETPY